MEHRNMCSAVWKSGAPQILTGYRTRMLRSRRKEEEKSERKRIMSGSKRAFILALCVSTVLGLGGCSSIKSEKRIVRISHAQSETHPEHLGLLKFKEYVEENLGDK